jgi:thiol-disulfide isomerase/thioredoxin
MKKFPALFILLVIFFLSLQSCGRVDANNGNNGNTPAGQAPEQLNTLQEGVSSLNFSLKSSNGNLYQLEDYRGHPVMLNFWATWCGPCKIEMPEIQKIYEEYQEMGLVVLAINNQGSPEEVSNYGKENGLSFPLLLDSDGQISGNYRVGAFPTSFFVDQDGIIRRIVIGSMDGQRLKDIITSTFPNLSETNISPIATSSEAITAPENKNSGNLMKGCITTNGLRARSGPSLENSILSYVNKGQCYSFDGRDKSNSWLRIPGEQLKNGKTSWVSATYVELTGDITTLPIVSGTSP